MQLTGQNIQPKQAPQAQFNSAVSAPAVPQPQVCKPCTQAPQQSAQVNCTAPAAQAPVTNPCQAQYPQGYIQPQYSVYPQYQQPQVQNMQVPATAAGVNIQIFNPTAMTPGAQAPTYNVNAPCYPSSYYTNSVGPDGRLHPNNGSNNPHTGDNVNNGTNSGTIGDNNNNTYTTNTTTNTTTTETKENGKTEKRKIVELTDDYIRNLESHLNSQEKAVRINAAKEVYARLEEDDSRHDDKALTALVNKMLQDPCEEVRVLALTALDGRICKGDDYTVGVLQSMQQNNNGYGQDAIDASNILLKMSGRQVEKEFEVKETPKKETPKKETKTTK